MMAFNGLANFLKDANKYASKRIARQGQRSILHSNDPVESTDIIDMAKMFVNTATGGIEAAGKGLKGAAINRIAQNEGLRKQFGVKNLRDLSHLSNVDLAHSMLMNQNGKYSGYRVAGAVAGSYMGVSAAGRIATGGGIYKDSDGNTDLIGVPFI